MNVLCHKPFDLCYKDTPNERNNKIKIKVFIFVFQSAAFSYEKIQQTRKIIKEKAVDNFVENPVDNYLLIH